LTPITIDNKEQINEVESSSKEIEKEDVEMAEPD
jgi:hypothetical protein